MSPLLLPLALYAGAGPCFSRLRRVSPFAPGSEELVTTTALAGAKADDFAGVEHSAARD